MRKFPKAFARRKSTANALEDLEINTTGESSFRVFDRTDRPDSGSKSFDGGIKLTKPGSASSRPGQNAAIEDNMFENLGNFRASNGSSSNTASMTTDKSSRLSAASTAPSSTDLHGKSDEWKSPHDKPFSNIPLPPAPKSSAFSLKNAGRSLSWGRSKASTPPTPKTPKDEDSKSKQLPSLPSADMQSSRARAVTSSSYASTAVPPKLDDNDFGLSMGGDFAKMFAGFGERKSVVMTPDRVMSQSPETIPPTSAHLNRNNSPAQLSIDNNKEIEDPPYSWGTQNSNDGLMANTSPLLPAYPSNPPPPVPVHATIRSNGEIRTVNSTARPGATSADGLRRSSALAGRRQSTLEYRLTVDEDAKLLRDSVTASRRLNSESPSSRVRDSWALPSQSRENSMTPDRRTNSAETTPRGKQPQDNGRPSEDSMFDSQIAAAADLASQFEENARTAQRTMPRKPVVSNKVMTPAQFERYKQDQERIRSFGFKPKEEEDEVDNYDDDEDEVEKAKQAAKQRKKQEAHMAVYRQQMMKITGEAPGMRPGLPVSQSTPDLHEIGKEGDDEDEEIPLAILQAHGFPNKNKPPVRTMGSNPNLRASTMLGGGGEGKLPVFARHLPQDPYYGAGLQRPMHRESMAFGGGAPSVSGATSRGAPPGGLVNVIANEERSRALRRGSPNAQGEYGPVPQNMGPGMYGGEMGPMGINPTMMTPGEAQMAAQMQQFMQMQMQFMHMMSQGQGPPSVQGGNPGMPMQGDMPRPNSVHHLRTGSGQPLHQRPMTMIDPNAAPWMHQGGAGTPSIRVQGYAPSIAPSERSNVGMPGRYRPVSYMPVASDNKSRLSTMSGALPNWETPKTAAVPTIRAVQKSGNASDEDEEGGWEEMARKREKKKSTWKSKRDTNSFKDILSFH